MEPGYCDLHMTQGDSFEIPLRAKETVAAEVGIDLTGLVFRSQMRTEPSGELLIEFTVDHSRLDEGYIVLSATAEQTASVTRPGVYDVEYEDADGHTRTILRGNISLTLGVTQ
jgi:hypothetical protein